MLGLVYSTPSNLLTQASYNHLARNELIKSLDEDLVLKPDLPMPEEIPLVS